MARTLVSVCFLRARSVREDYAEQRVYAALYKWPRRTRSLPGKIRALVKRSMLASVPLPASASQVPCITHVIPVMWNPPVTRAWRFPVARVPHVPPAFPKPDATNPEITRAGRNTIDFLLGRRWANYRDRDVIIYNASSWPGLIDTR